MVQRKNKGISGSFRANSLTLRDLSAMEKHELRLDVSGHKRCIRRGPDGAPVAPLLYDPYSTGLREGGLLEAHARHIEGARVNTAAKNVARHAFVQFPTKLKITAATERMMLDEAVKFTNRTHGDNAVFRARLDRDEEGRHGVDVFFAPKYQKKTTRRSSEWVSLTKFGKELAVQKFGQKQRQKKNKAGEFEPVFDKAGKPVMEDCDHQHYQGRALQDAFFEHLRDEMGLDWVVRGEKKIGRDSDRLEVEEYKIQAETEKLSFRAEVALEREQGLREKEAELTGREKKVKDGRFDRLLRRDPSAAEQVSAAQDAQREAENRIETVKAAAARDVAAAERRAAERFSERLRNVEQREREVKAQEDLLFAALLAVPPCSPGEEEKIGWIASDIDNTWVADVLDEHNAPEFIFDKELKLSTAMSLLKGWLRLQAQKIDQIFTEIIKRTTSVPRPASRPTAEPRRENPKQPHRAPEKKPDPKSNTPKQRFDPWTDGPPGP